jgi:hypothetical protein
MKKTLAFFFLISLMRNSVLSQSVSSLVIHGRVIDSSIQKSDKIAFAQVMLLDSASKMITGTISDTDGRFKFDKDLKASTYSIKVEYTYQDTLFAKFVLKRDTVVLLNIHRICKYDRSLADSICPICHKKNKVIPIIYGLMIHSIKNNKNFHIGGCDISPCQPHWYCKRDNFEF